MTNSFFLFHHNHHYHNHHFGVPSFIYPSAAAATAAIVAADPAADAATGGGSFRPRSHSGIEGISRAKIKSVRQTVVIIAGYIACSAPAIAFQMWAVWIKEEKNLSTEKKKNSIVVVVSSHPSNLHSGYFFQHIQPSGSSGW